MRLRPPLAALAREATADTSLAGVTIETGTQVYALLRAMHRRSDLYPDPDEFRPERFGVSGSPDRTLPFGMGCHYCVGSPFAMMQNPLLIAMLLHRFDVERYGDGPLGENRFFLQPPPRARFVLHRR
jgi:cytochrome P450